jgi:hypothetical protein
VEDILITYNTIHTNPDTITQYANSMHRCLQLKPTLESKGQIRFLDLAIIRNDTQIEIDFFRKPTTTDTTIIYKSNHQGEHKLAAYRYYIERIFNLPPSKYRQHKEWQTILHIARNNNFPTSLICKLKHRIQQKTTHAPHVYAENNKKWAIFTFTFPHVRRITNLFKNTNIKIAFKCSKTIAKLTKYQTTTISRRTTNGVFTN